jgi:hypothetical protein
MPVQQGMNFGDAGNSDNKRKSASRRVRRPVVKKQKATQKPAVEVNSERKDVSDETAAVTEPKAEKQVDIAANEDKAQVGVETDVQHDVSQDVSNEDINVEPQASTESDTADKFGKMGNLRSVKDSIASRDFTVGEKLKSPNRKVLIGLGIGAGVLAVLGITLAIVRGSQQAALDAPVVEPTYENADHQDGQSANGGNTSSDVAITGYIETGSGFSYQYPSFADSENVELVGKIRNDTDKDVSSVGINFFLYDTNGVLIGTAADGTDVVKAGTEWEFHAKCATDVKRSDVARFLIDQLQFGELDVTSSIAKEGAGITNAESSSADEAKANEKSVEANGSTAGANAANPLDSGGAMERAIRNSSN